MEQKDAKDEIKLSLKNKVGDLVTSQPIDNTELKKIENLQYSMTEANLPVKIGNYYVVITRNTLGKGQYEYSYSIVEPVTTTTHWSTAMELRESIATWYIALRTIALVGLLSVLVYIGIRIILCSVSAQDKAKYKNMLKDWLVAICLLFVLHYIMAFMLGLSSKLGDIIKDNVISGTVNLDGTQEDKLITNVRTKVGESLDDAHAGDAAGYTIMYIALVILTGIFTVHYLKRVIYMAFLTMIAPMIALTYPIDKVKDGKAQAFSYWLREYIFNCLIQPVHLLIYTILIVNALNYAQNNILYAIVALAFMVPAEKIIKEMFGMKSSSPTGQLGAAAGGAMVMSMINKMKNVKGPKDDAGSGNSNNSSGVRTANNTGATNSGNTVGNSGTLTNGNSPSSNGRSSGGPTGGGTGSPLGGPTGTSSNTASNNSSTSSSNTSNTSTSNSSTSNSSTSNSSTSNSSITGSSRAGRGLPIRAVNKLASGTGKLTRKAGGALLGAAAGTIALAAQVADGDLFDNPEKALTDTLIGAGAGYVAGNALTGQVQSKASGAKAWMDKKQLGIDEYNNIQFDRKFYQSEGYKSIKEDAQVQAMCEAAGIPVRNAVQNYLNAGITDTNKIKEALQSGIGGDEYKAYNDSGIDSIKNMTKLQNAGINAQIYKDIYKDKEIDDATKISKLKKKYPNLSDNGLANRMAIAKDAPKNKDGFISWARAKYKNLDDAGAEKLYKEIVNFF